MIDLQKQIFDIFQPKEATRLKIGISVDANVFKLYSLCVGLLMLKTILMSFATRQSQSNQQAVLNEEDCKEQDDEPICNNSKFKQITERSPHLSDIEHVYPFIIIATLYMVAVQPSYAVATLCFLGFTILRFIHTFVHLASGDMTIFSGFWMILEFCRGLASAGGVMINLFMLSSIVYNSW